MKNAVISLSFILIGTTARTAYACSVCFGDPNSAVTKAVKSGVVFLLVVTGGVLGAMGWTFLTWAKRARQLSCSQNPGFSQFSANSAED